jgi:hypothetical protein
VSTLSLSPVSTGVFTALNVPALTALATGGISDVDVPALSGFPRVWFTVGEENARGLGRGGLRRINLRVYGADESSGTTEGVKRLQLLMAAVVSLLEDATLTLVGYQQAGEIVYVDTVEPYDELIAGVRCLESVAHFYFWVEPT